MRCASCHSYIPEGLSSPVICPQCLRPAESPSEKPQPAPADFADSDPTESAATPPPLPEEPARPAADPASRLGLVRESAAPSEPVSNVGYAPFFSIQTSLAFGPASTQSVHREPARGSVSFGETGMSIVFDGGRNWEKLDYRDIISVRMAEDSVYFTARGTESRLTFYHPWLPTWLAGPRRARAATFLELFGRVKSGLTPYEISLFRRRLQ